MITCNTDWVSIMYQNKEYKGIIYAVCNIGKSIEFTVIQFSWILWVQVHTSHTYVYPQANTPNKSYYTFITLFHPRKYSHSHKLLKNQLFIWSLFLNNCTVAGKEQTLTWDVILDRLETVSLSELLRQHEDRSLHHDELVVTDVQFFLGEGKSPQHRDTDPLEKRYRKKM